MFFCKSSPAITVVHEMIVTAMFLSRWRKGDGFSRWDPRHESKVSLTCCFNPVRMIGSVLLQVSQLSMPSWTLSFSRKRSKSGCSAPGIKSAPRGSKSTDFAKGILQLFNLQQMLWIQYGNLLLNPFIIWHTYDSKLQLEKFLESEIGVFWVAPRYRFRNLRFKHRGM